MLEVIAAKPVFQQVIQTALLFSTIMLCLIGELSEDMKDLTDRLKMLFVKVWDLGKHQLTSRN